jgi:hypothetical protein
VLVRIDESSVALTPFGSLVRPAPRVRASSGPSWMEKLRAIFALFFC